MKGLVSALLLFFAGCASESETAITPAQRPAAAQEAHIGDAGVIRIARKHYGAAASPTDVSNRRALLVTFERTKAWGELRFLLVQMPEPRNLRIVALQNAAGNYPNSLQLSKQEVTSLFSNETFEELKRYGRSWCGDVFASPDRGERELSRILIPVIARRCLVDGGSFGREKEWREVYFRIEPMLVSEHEFATHSGHVISCSVFLDDGGALVCHTPNGIIYVD